MSSSPIIPALFDAVVPAAGVGKRMGAQVPKQYLKLTAERTILEATVEKLLACPFIEHIIIAVSPDDPYFPQLSISRYPQVVRADGGKERADSVLSGLQAAGAPWVLVHDAARPLVSMSDIEKLARTCLEHDCAGILASPAADTLKWTAAASADAAIFIEKTLPRERIYRAQTPQCARRKVLLEALQQAAAQDLAVTDEASALELCGQPVLIVPGRSDNFKITTAEDLLLAKALLHYEH